MDDLALINWLHDGCYRIKVLKILKSPNFPKNIAKSLKIHKSSLSRILNDLREKGLINKITSSSRTLTYAITPFGEEILKKIDSKNDTN